MAGIARQHGRADAQDAKGGLIAFFGGDAEENIVGCRDVEPGVLGHLAFELARTPTRIAQRDEHELGAASIGDLLEHITRGGKGQFPQGDAGTVIADRRMKHETTVGLHRTTKKYRSILYRADLKREVEVDTL